MRDESIIPSKLYKYAQENSIDKILTDLTIRFSPIDKTNDPFEANPNWLAQFAFTKIVRDYVTSNNFLSDVFKQNKIQYMRDNSKPMVAKIIEDGTANMFFFSLSETPYIEQMWAYYAQCGEGIAIEFNMENSWFKPFRIAKIYYTDEKNAKVDDVNFAFEHKRLDWSHEQEWRILHNKSDYKASETTDAKGNPVYLLHYDPIIISKIILGYNISDDNLQKVKKIVAEKFPHTKITKLEVDIYARSFREKIVI